MTSDTGKGAGAVDGVRGRTFMSTKVTDGGVTRPLVAGSRISLTFTDDGIRAQAGCNYLHGSAKLDGGRLVVGKSLVMTEMGCQPGLAEQDEWLAKLLSTGPRLSVNGDRLVLTSGTTVVELVDRRVAEPDRPLVATTWTLDGTIDGDTAASAPNGVVSTLQIDPGGRVTFDFGCNTGTARATITDDRIRFGAIRSTRYPCPSPPSDVAPQVESVLDGSTVTYEITGNSLRISNGTRGLTYRALDDHPTATATR